MRHQSFIELAKSALSQYVISVLWNWQIKFVIFDVATATESSPVYRQI